MKKYTVLPPDQAEQHRSREAIMLFSPDGSPIPLTDSGLAGPMGPQGPEGPPGPKGDVGNAGPAGARGPIGDTGPAGADGIQGPPGANGSQGPKGDTGAAGADGPMGPVGPQGPQGNPGAQGPQGIQGPAGAQGTAGAGFTNRQAWSTANAYSARDVVTYQGSSFVALNDVAAGGSNPRADTVNWLVWAQGGGEIAYAEYSGGTIVGPAAAATLFDVPGLSIPVPAGTGRHTIEAAVVAQLNWSAAAVTADSTSFRLAIIDEAGNWITQSIFKLPAIASYSEIVHFHAKRSVAAPAAAKTYKASLYVDTFTHITSTALFSTAAVPGATAAYGLPAWIQATAL